MPDVPFVRRKVTVGARVIAYREEAEPRDQPPLVLIHGLGMSSKSFRPLPAASRGWLPCLCP
jgi:pimeloyl-ACP methyl ester carboxylesterase